MTAKFILSLGVCALIQSAAGQCFSRMASPIAPCHAGLAYDGFVYDGLALAPAAELAASHGGGLVVTSSSCTAPTGLAVASENEYEGCVGVVGNLPFLGTAAMEGVFPTAGVSAISYGCGDGAVGITAEAPVEAAIAPIGIAPAAIAPAVIAPAATSWGYKGVPTCGCGSLYY